MEDKKQGRISRQRGKAWGYQMILSSGRRNFCEEDKEILLGDDTAKIFLNAESVRKDVSKGLEAFLDYVAGKRPEDPFVWRLEEAVERAKKNREWRHEYMTLLMRDQENFERGIEKGIEKGIYEVISVCREVGIPEDDIAERLQQKFHLSKERAERYLQEKALVSL